MTGFLDVARCGYNNDEDEKIPILTLQLVLLPTTTLKLVQNVSEHSDLGHARWVVL